MSLDWFGKSYIKKIRFTGKAISEKYSYDGKIMKFASTYLFLFCSLLAGCTTAQYHAFEKQEKDAVSRSVTLKVMRPDFQIVVNKDDRVLSICNMLENCEQSAQDSEIIEISKDRIGLGGSSYFDVRCGFGSVPTTDLDTYYHVEKSCNSRFYKTSDRYLGTRVLAGLLTFGIYPLIMFNAHKESFDEASFEAAAYNAHIHELQALLNLSDNSDKRKDSISVVRVDASNIDDTYKAIVNKPINTDSVVFIDDETQKPLYYLRFSDYADKELPDAVNQQLSDFLNSLALRASTSNVANTDVVVIIPPDVALPELPTIPQLTKSEYETKDDFNERVSQAVSDREDAIRKLQQQYKRDVNNRNQYIVALGESWQQYLDGKAVEKNEEFRKLKKHQNELARLLYAMNIGRFSASDMSYDAETKSLYFTATSSRFNFRQKMRAKLPAEEAQSIKENRRYALTPELVVQDGEIQMKALQLMETRSGDEFESHYTDINYKPDLVSVRVATGKLNINKEQSIAFKSYVQKPQALMDTNVKEVWYIDTVKQINARMPEWYATPEKSSNVLLGLGSGISYDEAMLSARKELAAMVNTKIYSTQDILTTSNTIRSFRDATQHTQATSDVEFKAGDISVLHQAEMDGKHYVALCYRCNAN